MICQTILTFILYIGSNRFIDNTQLIVDDFAHNRHVKKLDGALSFSGTVQTSMYKTKHRQGRNENLRLSNEKQNNESTPSRREMITTTLKIPIFAIASYAYGRVLYNAMSSTAITTLFNSGAPIYPLQHEQRISAMIQKAFDASSETTKKTVFRVLEIGIGTEARLIRRGLYNDAIHHLSKRNGIHRLEITGLDLHIPTKEAVVNDTTNVLQQIKNTEGIDVALNLIQSSITEPLPQQFSDGYFDSIVFSFTLCSVDDPISAIRTMKRLLRPNGGTMAYLEHVAVNDNDDTDHQLLSIEQHVFDPLQQILADHCHLHRSTETTMDTILQINDDLTSTTTPPRQTFQTLYRERFYVDDMWPVSCQACGVIQSFM